MIGIIFEGNSWIFKENLNKIHSIRGAYAAKQS
jgi:hypothetical protein